MHHHLWLAVHGPPWLTTNHSFMDGKSGSDTTKPLLAKDDRSSADNGGRRSRLSRRNSVNSLRAAFVSKLPEKLRSSHDSESPYDLVISSTTALTQGLSLSLSLSLSLYIYIYDVVEVERTAKLIWIVSIKECLELSLNER